VKIASAEMAPSLRASERMAFTPSRPASQVPVLVRHYHVILSEGQFLP